MSRTDQGQHEAAPEHAPTSQTSRVVIGALGLVIATATLTLVGARHFGLTPRAPAANGASDSKAGVEKPDEGAGHHVVVSDEARRKAHIEVSEAGPGRVWNSVQLPGEVALNSDTLAHVTPRVTGTVREVKAQLGDVVKKGDVLAVLESRELAEISKDARTTAEHTKLAQANFLRLDTLFKDGAVPEKAQLAAKSELDEARIAEEAAAQTYQSAGSSAGGATYTLRSPLDGTVIQKQIALGQVAKDDALSFVVADLSSVWIDLTVYAKDLTKVEIGQPVTVVAQGIDEPARGKIVFLGATASNEARTTRARVVLESPGQKWRPGLFVTADVAVSSNDAAIVVADDAIQMIDGKSVIFVEERDGFEAREVELGAPGHSAEGVSVVAISGGLSKGERYATKNAFILKADLGKGSAHED